MKNNRRNLAHRSTRTLLVTAVTLALSPAALGASGQFTFVTGDVRVQTTGGRTVAATRGMEVNPGDLIITGNDGMAQLAMVDSARLSLRSQSQMKIESYARSKEGTEGAVLSLLRGTMRTFTGLISPTAREKYAMRTKVATVGIRGSGNILYHCDTDCPPTEGGAQPKPDTTLNHTIEGSHNIQTLGMNIAPVVTGPGQTVQINEGQPPRFIPTPDVILEAGRIMSGKQGQSDSPPPEEGRAFGAPDPNAGGTPPPTNPVVGNNGLGFTVTDASGNIVGADPLGIRDIVVSAGFPFSSQATSGSLTLDATTAALRAFTSYAGLQSGVTVNITGGAASDLRTVDVGGSTITIGRWSGATLTLPGTVPNSAAGVHFGHASAGFPAYLSEVLTGEATYTLAAATSPTNQAGATGNLGSATVSVNFSNRTLGAQLAVTLGGANWNLNAQNVPISLNNFFASTGDRLVVTNGGGQNSRSNSNLFGSLEGSFVGSGLGGIILGYSFTDQTGAATSFNTISGIAALVGSRQNSAAQFRTGLISGSGSGSLQGSTLAFNRPSEVTQDATTGQIRGFAAAASLPGIGFVPYANFSVGTASVQDAGFDPTTGLSWGRWSGGVANITSGSASTTANLANSSLHYIFAGTQSGPVSLPLTGSASYDVVGSTRPTNGSAVGTFGSATLNANFTARTVDLGVSFAINGQNWSASASNVPIYRDLTFGAYAGAIPPGTAALNISCSPSCGTGATGAVDGFFTGRNGRGAGMMYNVGGTSGAVAFNRRGG
ncbi:MAG: hypothetical protein SF172_15650 [Burkholderiales bacterium]|nr:hypothetical protein [Burkholderiales bacterium]